MRKLTAVLTAILLLPFCLPALEYGLIVDQNAAAGGAADADPIADYQAGLIPRISGLFGETSDKLYGDFVVTAGVTAGMTLGIENDFYFVPELLRTELTLRFGAAKLTAGRMQYSAPFAYAADGLFDGLQFAYNGPSGMFYAGAWYTGLLYKKKANITITEEDYVSYSAAVEYKDFAETYFASKRMAAALGWEYPALANLLRTKLAVIAQIDLNDRDDKLHSQYLTAKIGIPANQFTFELSGAVDLAQVSTLDGKETNIGLAGEAGIFWTTPTKFPSRISLNGYFSSGKKKEGSLAAFVPITDKHCGSILEAKLSGISAFGIDYTALLHKTLSLGFTSTYFMRNDLGTYKKYPVDVMDEEGYLLGNEFFARAMWIPASDLQFNLGGGVFLPAIGNAAPERNPVWRVKLAAVLAIF